MADDNDIILKVGLDPDNIKKDIKDLEGDLKKEGKNSGDSFSESFGDSAVASFSKLALKITGVLGAIGGALFSKQSIEAAIEQENAVNRFNASLRSTGSFTEEASKRFQEYASTLQETTGIGDELILSNAAVLSSVGKLSGQGLERATQASLDFATALGIDTKSAFDLVAKAASGSTESLSRYGIRIQKTGDAQKDFNTLLDKLETSFSGQAASRLNTFAGQAEKLKNTFGDFQEVIGNIVIKSPTLVAIFKSIGDALFRLKVSLDEATSGKDLIGAFLNNAAVFARGVNEFLIAPLEFFINISKTVFNAFITGVQSIVVAVADTASGLVSFGARFSDTFKGAKDTLDTFRDSSRDTLDQFALNTKDSFDSINDFSFTSTIDEKLADFQTFLDTVTPITQAGGEQIRDSVQEPINQITFEQVVEAMQQAANKIQVTAAGIAKSINMGLVNGVANGFAAVGRALVSGENLFEAFGKAVLSSFGQVLIQLGTQTLAVGLLMANVPILFGLQGAAAVAAGAGMIIAGGALVAIAGASGGAAGAAVSAGTGGGIGAGDNGNFGQGIGSNVDLSQQQQEPQTQVVVNVQGNILDRKETGLELADIINDAFGSQGVIIARNAV